MSIPRSPEAADASGSPTSSPDELSQLRAERDRLRAELAEATASIVHWRAAALHRWEESASGNLHSDMAEELQAMRNTLSWRVTKPLRAVRSRMPATPDGR